MSDLHRAAILLTTLPDEEAAAIMARLEPKQVEDVSIEIARLKNVSGVEQEQVIRTFADSNPAMGSDSGGMDRARSLMTKALGQNASAAIDNVRQSIEAVPFSFLRTVDNQNILTYIIDEHPQTIALILSHLPPATSSLILAGLEPERQLAVVQRIANMQQTNPDIIAEVEKGLERRMSSVMSQSFENAGGVDAVAEILNVSDRSTEKAILESMSQEDPDLVEEIRRLMFIFEDIGKFGDKEIQTVLKHIENSQWSLALKSASVELREKVFKNMSQRAADMLREEMEFMGAVKLSAVESKQQEIVDVVRRLEDTGEIEINTSGEAEQLVS
ncbi:flagellar motor switch protein FliG [Adhaeretor mobilis]|uniref:Flagellar motor switch protein FliG n=1 Tax=Adhaeretor mobilis TaxID=1930276 RepID=A0A517MS67_9BACT|nr:flagellar motor switch protein FliG [Adhaeretor mobilis]QDS97729.1 Flagellar motor switch protein FliG [Adhaeretor mobilis]